MEYERQQMAQPTPMVYVTEICDSSEVERCINKMHDTHNAHLTHITALRYGDVLLVFMKERE